MSNTTLAVRDSRRAALRRIASCGMAVGLAALSAWPAGRSGKAAVTADAIPKWLDTVPPVVTIVPKEKYHTSIFHVSLSANKIATLYVGINSRTSPEIYRRPVTITQEGQTIVYFHGEDDFGNKSAVDSMVYILDTRPPDLTVSPAPGRFGSPVRVRLSVNERCRFFSLADPDAVLGAELPESLLVRDSLGGYACAVDEAGNRSTAVRLSYVVDTARIDVRVVPPGGVFNAPRKIRFEASQGADVFYSFDAMAAREDFVPYGLPVMLPYGLTLVSFYARSSRTGKETETVKARFVVDTVPPKIKLDYLRGRVADTIVLSTRKPATIWYVEGDGLTHAKESSVYRGPLTVPHKGMYTLRAVARDSVGNVSAPVQWSYTFDRSPSVVSLAGTGGKFRKPVTAVLQSSKPATIFYTLNGDTPTTSSLVYKEPIVISREGTTVLRYFGVDDGGNRSEEKSAVFEIDTRPPQVKARVEKSVTDNSFTVTLLADRGATTYYEKGNRQPTRSSPVFKESIVMQPGETLRYFSVDSAGNATPVKTIGDPGKPLVFSSPPPGVYNRRLRVYLGTNVPADVFWREPPDTEYKPYTDSLPITSEGLHTLEYYARTPDGAETPTMRNEYLTDWTAPRADVTVRKGYGDSVIIFFDCSENASIYYTIDGTSPFFSRTVRIAANKLFMAHDRICVKRSDTLRLAYFAEDAVGNQSGMTIVDLAKPRAIPSIPAGGDRVYSRLLSVGFSSFDERARIYYARHGRTPKIDSLLYSGPITLSSSDTILAFVVDASGYRGAVDTFVYHIDLPPTAQFTVSPEAPVAGDPTAFDAGPSFDQETPPGKLLYRWDFNGDGTFETAWFTEPRTVFTYAQGGLFRPVLEVKDEMGHVSSTTRDLSVRDLCPDGMVFVAADSGATVCVDVYEWPNLPRKTPRTRVSWIEATMSCAEAGKRLCTADEWVKACRGTSKSVYPYGSKYIKDYCPTEGKSPHKAGAFDRCVGSSGVHDMIGNVWEWVEDRHGDYPVIYGGSYNSGASANCLLFTTATVATESEDVGFRCCK